MKKIIYVSRLLKWIAIAAIAILPVAEAGYWITNGYPFLESYIPFDALPSFGGWPVTWERLNDFQKFLGFMINLAPLSFSMIALSCLARLFSAFQRLVLFDRENVVILKRAGWALVWGQIVYPVYVAALSLALTYRNPVGERNLTIGFGGHQFEILAIGLSIILASWVFEAAVKIHEEQQATV